MNKTILDYIYLAPPTLVSKYPRKEGQKPGYDYYGVYFEWMNPLANLERGTQVESVRDYVTINARPTWHIIPGLTLKGQVGYRIASGMDKKDRNAYVFLDYFSGNESGTFGAVKSATYTTRTSYWMVGATLDWTKEFGDHRINILGGWNEEVDRRNGWDDVALLSFFGKAYYSYKDKYLAEVGIRRDGSSLFGDGTSGATSLRWPWAGTSTANRGCRTPGSSTTSRSAPPTVCWATTTWRSTAIRPLSTTRVTKSSTATPT